MSPLTHHTPQCWARTLATATALLLALVPAASHAQTDVSETRETVRVVTDSTGWRLQVAGRDFLVRGMNWDYIPIGQNYSFDLWQQPDDMITRALDREMSLIAGMGANTIRVNAGIPPRWVRYVHDRYGIYSIINHPVGRYGWTLDGVWHPSVDYSDPRMRAALTADVGAMVDTYRACPGVLMYLLGNENNYGLSWSSFEIEALPKGERDQARARHLYSLFDAIARATKAQDPGVPVAIANGDVQYLNLIAEECKDVDILGCNVYRGISSGDLFKVVRDQLARPMMYTEFGSDAFNASDLREDQAMQARYLIGQWREIYEQTAGHGRQGDAIGGCVFQWSDGWWKYKQTERLDVHDTNASWPDGGYVEDYHAGENNMNEEWWGICAKGAPDSRGLYELYPRAAYYALRRAFALDPYAPSTTNEAIHAHFAAITPGGSALEARGNQAALLGEANARARVSGVRMQLETFSTGGDLVNTPKANAPGGAQPSTRGFDQLQSFYTEFQAQPSPAVMANLSVNILGNVPRNPIDQLFYENRGLARPVQTDSGTVLTSGLDRIKVYQASMSWEDRWFGAQAFYRTGHFHWGYEGDFFGLYREANYGPNVDIYNADAPVGVELSGKRAFDGLKAAFGPQLWWGAPPSVLFKYRRQVGRFDAAAMLEKDLPTQSAFAIVGSTGVRLQPTTKASLYLKTAHGPYTLEGGGIWAGANRVDQPFPVAVWDAPSASYQFRLDRVRDSDALGGKLRLTGTQGRLMWYAQGASMGLVAEAGPTATTTFTGWTLKDSGLGNQRNLIGGFVWNQGRLQIGPNFLWQKPLVGPIPQEARDAEGIWRDNLKDPFSVRSNREMTAGEIQLSWDPTPATWLYAWDNDQREDARLAGSVGFVYRHMPTNMDPAVGLFSDAEAKLYGTPTYVFAGSTPPRILREVNVRIVSRLSSQWRLVAHAYTGNGEPTLTNDPRLVHRSGVDLRLAGGANTLTAYAKWNDWGPYDYDRDFNLTYPVQLMGDYSHTLGAPQWFETNPQTRIGVRATWRSLDQYSPRYTERYLDTTTNEWFRLNDAPNGREWEIRTYVMLAM